MKNKILLSGLMIFIISINCLYGQMAITKNDTIKLEQDSVIFKLNDYRGSVKWQYSKDAENWNDMTNADVDTLLIASPDSSGFYRVKVLDGTCDPVYSDTTYYLRKLTDELKEHFTQEAGTVNKKVTYFQPDKATTQITIDTTGQFAKVDIVTTEDLGEIKPGFLLVDTTGIGQIILVTNYFEQRSAGGVGKKLLEGIQVGVDFLINDQELSYSSRANRTKNWWNNPLKLNNADAPKNFIFEPYLNGLQEYIENEFLTIDFSNTTLWNVSDGDDYFRISIMEGYLKLNPAIDFYAKYYPVALATLPFLNSIGIINPLIYNTLGDYFIKGMLNELRLITYNDLDFRLKLNFEASVTRNRVFEPVKIAQFWYSIPAGPLAISIKTDLIARLNLNASGRIYIQPDVTIHNNLVLGIQSVEQNNQFQNEYIFENKEELGFSSEYGGNFNFVERFEIVPSFEVYIYGLVGFTGQLIPYQKFEFNASVSNDHPIIYDCTLDVGIDAEASLDISAFHFDPVTAKISKRNWENAWTKNLFHAPSTLKYISGNGQSGFPNSTLNYPLRVEVLNSANKAMPDFPVFFDVTSGGGLMNASSVKTSSSGIASNNWSLGNNGPQKAVALLKKSSMKETIDQIEFTATLNNFDVPYVSTLAASNIGDYSATINGNVHSDGGTGITQRGFFWCQGDKDPTNIDSVAMVSGTLGSYSKNLSGLKPGTLYSFKSFATNSVGTVTGIVYSFVTNSPTTPPSVTTLAATDITKESARLNGTVVSDGGAAITERGFYWSSSITNPGPENGGTKVIVSGTTGNVNYILSGLQASTPYYFTAYAKNNKGTTTGQSLAFTTSQTEGPVYGSFTDARDGKVYKTVKIGGQTWMAENLAYLPSISRNSENSYTDPYYYVNKDLGTDLNAAKQSTNFETYGVLYNWPAAMAGAVSSSSNPSKVQGVCPTGWHLPSNSEWTQLENYLADNGYNYDGTIGGGNNKIGKSMAATTDWVENPTTGAPGNNLSLNNKSGFTGLPGGLISDYYNGGIGYYGVWWSSTEQDWDAWIRALDFVYSDLGVSTKGKNSGLSVRCVRD